MKLDHLVINARFQSDAAADIFSALGFTLTPRGRHTLGSVNNLIMFDDHYLELIGLPSDGGKLRQEVLDSPGGIDGLVMQTAEPEILAATLKERGFDMGPVQRFSRPVDVDGVSHDACFVTTRLAPGQVDAGRVYYCQHLTPELVWRAPWLHHENAVNGIAALTVVGHDPAALLKQYSALDVPVYPVGASGLSAGDKPMRFATRFMTQATFAAHFTEPFGAGFEAFRQCMPVLAAVPGGGTAAPDQTGDAAPRNGYFGAITLRAAQPQAVAERALAMQLPVHGGAERVLVAVPALSTFLEFIR